MQNTVFLIPLAWMSLMVTPMLLPKKYLWSISTIQGALIASYTTYWLFHNGTSLPSTLLIVDNVSSPLIFLTCWLFPLTMFASAKKVNSEPTYRQRIYIINSTMLQLTTLWALTTSSLLLFFILFELSLIPTMIMITFWNIQERKIEMATFFISHTMLAAAPVTIWVKDFYILHDSLPWLTEILTAPQSLPMFSGLFWVIFAAAFLAKLPLYSLSLWLPKTQTEIPIAGPMVMTTTLLKLGGYIILRTPTLLPDYFTNLSTLASSAMILAILTAATLCFFQSNSETMVAATSVTVMYLVVAGTMILAPWALSGALATMVAHGLVSSTLLCLSNTAYERDSINIMFLIRVATLALPLLGVAWLLVPLAERLIPPEISFVLEMTICSLMFNWSVIAFMSVILDVIHVIKYILFILRAARRQALPFHTVTNIPTLSREHFLLLLLSAPGVFLSVAPIVMTMIV